MGHFVGMKLVWSSLIAERKGAFEIGKGTTLRKPDQLDIELHVESTGHG